MSQFKTTTAFAVVAGLCMGPRDVRAQQPPDSAIRRQQRTIDSLSTAMRAMQSQLDSLARTSAAAPASQPAAQPRTSAGSGRRSSRRG